MALVVPFSFAGCKKNDKLIRINEVTHSVFYAPMYLADALGYFEEEDIEIELTNGGGADATMAAVLSGAADIGFCGPEAVIYVAVGGSNDQPKVFGQLTKRDGSFLVGREKIDNFDWSMLEGKSILAGRQGGVPAMTFEYVLDKLGVNAKLNYDVAFNMMTAAFESGISDYCTMFEPTASEYQAAGKGYIVGSVGQDSGELPYTC
ncbi:MAG: ABC transporter substrate-binding protein, partial [Clostridia bacterium]|nr:ABC transporter substrate-binding protein [Clostridia bacterium]